jgi:glycosyltransferase involved in cell wall biosynthesis
VEKDLNNPPTVSIVIINYNYGRFLREAIDSALRQTYPHIEVVVVDDGSTDNSREIIASYGSKVVPVLKKNGGQGSAFNAGFAVSRGEMVIFLDADDYLFPRAVEQVVTAWEPGVVKESRSIIVWRRSMLSGNTWGSSHHEIGRLAGEMCCPFYSRRDIIRQTFVAATRSAEQPWTEYSQCPRVSTACSPKATRIFWYPFSDESAPWKRFWELTASTVIITFTQLV